MIARLALLGAVSLVTMGAQSSCSSSNGEGLLEVNDPPASGSGSGPTFTTTLVLKNSAGAVTNRFQRGELIMMELTTRNRTDQPVVLQFSSGAQSDCVVFDNGGRAPLWRWLDGKFFTQATTETTFQANETRTGTFTWNQERASGELLPTGSYEARCVLLFMEYHQNLQAPHELGSTLVPFTITP
jgi:hypothetical protein